jgi:anthranilate synthase component 1
MVKMMTASNLTETNPATFTQNYNSGKTQLYWRWITGDLETPVSAYLKLCQKEQYSFLLESVEGGKTLGRYSIIGFKPDLIWQYQNKEVTLDKKKIDAPAITSLRETIKSCAIEEHPEDLPPMAVSGLFGTLGYDMIRLIESIPDENPDDLQIPESILIRPTILVIFDNVKNMICFVQPVYAHANNSKTPAVERLKAVKSNITMAIGKLTAPANFAAPPSNIPTPLDIKSNTPKDRFLDNVKQTKKYIRAGDIFQAVISQRFETDFDLPPFQLYRSLRRLNPSPFLFFLNMKDFALVGSSPEILVRVRDNNITIRPIAGTRKRGTNRKEDEALAQELLNDEKERAEHLMLLDLGRNDVGAVSQYGSVEVTDSFIIEYYSHVMHIVSNVEGKLAEDKDSLDAFFSGFPAGTVSGAPKIRAMQIIDELEVARRGTYAGAVGYFSGNGDIDTCITLRTALVKNGKIYVQAGGGVVADSNAEFEYQESVNKASAVFAAAQDAIRGSKQH